MLKLTQIIELNNFLEDKQEHIIENNFQRLQKFLSAVGYCSRRKGEEYILSGFVSVNGNIITELGFKVDPLNDKVELKGKLLNFNNKLVYIALNKPKGYITSCKHAGEKVVTDLISIPQRIYPVGRLDKDSKGLLIMTNDGSLHYRLSHPSFEHEKEYIVTVEKPISDESLYKMSKGMDIQKTRTMPAKVNRISSQCFKIILKEGKKRQIRIMVRNTGNNVIDLQRIRIANIKLGRLSDGNWRYLTQNEKNKLLEGIEKLKNER